MTSAAVKNEVKTQTAGNNADLARVKAAMNAPIYKSTLIEYNAAGRKVSRSDKAAYLAAGRDAARAYVGQFFNDETRASQLDVLFPTA